MFIKRRTKIVATIGPVTASREMLLGLVNAGMDVARLNFSHGDHAEFVRLIRDLRSIEAETGRSVGIMGDIQGPKLRVAKLEGQELELPSGVEVLISAEPTIGGFKDGKYVVSTGYKDFVKDVAVGNTVLLDDGLLGLKVIGKSPKGLNCLVIDGGLLKENKGINVPEASFSASAITEKDYADILFCVEQGVDFIAMSFVRTAQEVRHLKRFLESREKNIQVFAKIEKKDALTNLDAIVDACDGILVARGDLAVEVGNEKVPVLQKKIVSKSNVRGKTVIIATQMLMSMVDNPRPSRAEASDVANAVLDGADALMLSNETTVGKYPLETVKMMDKIILQMEREAKNRVITSDEWETPPEAELSVAVVQSAVRLSAVLNSPLLAVLTQSGKSGTLVSKCRPDCRLVVITSDQHTYRQQSMRWGVEPLFIPDLEELITQTAVFEAIANRLKELHYCKTGDRVVITAGLPKLRSGSTNAIKVQQI